MTKDVVFHEEVTCVQCNRALEYTLDEGETFICTNPECPNFGLVQVGMEDVEKYIDESIN